MATDYIRENLKILRSMQTLENEVQDIMENVSLSLNEEATIGELNNITAGDDIEEPDTDKGALDTVPYTTNDEMLSSITQVCKERFGASFTKSKTPMLYYPKDGDVTLTGEITSLNNAVFQFRFKDSTGNGCYVWVEPIHITDETIKTLNIINGVYKNWKNELSTSEDIKPMSMRNEGVLGGELNESLVDICPGDDID